MINIINGAKGTDKTKNIIERANAAVLDGDVVFITDSSEYTYSITHKVRLINALDYHVSTEEGLLGFISGVVASNHDVKHVYLDGSHRICGKKASKMKVFYANIGEIADKADVDITLTVSCDDDNIPSFVKKFIK